MFSFVSVVAEERGVSPSEVGCKDVECSIELSSEVKENDLVFLDFEVDCAGVFIILPSEVSVVDTYIEY